MLDRAKPAATFLLNSPYPADEVWDQPAARVAGADRSRSTLDLWVIDAYAVAAEVGMGSRINTIMQPCFFQLSGVLPPDEAIAHIKGSVEKTYGKRGDGHRRAQLRRHRPLARSAARASRSRTAATGELRIEPPVPDDAPGVRPARHGACSWPATATCCR